jgi:hypothetical protein
MTEREKEPGQLAADEYLLVSGSIDDWTSLRQWQRSAWAAAEAAVRADERERCAKRAETFNGFATCSAIAAAIRDLGESP